MRVDGVKESQYKFKVSMKYINDDSVYQIPPKVTKMITPAKEIQFIVSLYPHPLRTLHTVFQLEFYGATYPFFLHSQVAFSLIYFSYGDGVSLK